MKFGAKLYVVSKRAMNRTMLRLFLYGNVGGALWMTSSTTVILPCYNGARWVSRAIESILDQTYKNFELLIIDDGSTDNSKATIAPHLRDERVRYIYQKNRGFSAAINRGIKASSGSLIGFIGQDGLWMPNKLEVIVYSLRSSF